MYLLLRKRSPNKSFEGSWRFQALCGHCRCHSRTSSLEQNVLALRYAYCKIGEKYEVQERFLDFLDNQGRHSKTGEVIASVILDTLKKLCIPFQNCLAQGYDNASNMTGVIKV